MFEKKVWQFLIVISALALLLAACGGQPAVDQPVVEEPAAEEPAAEEPAVEAPSEVQFCVLLAVGLDQGWDRTFFESFERVKASSPVAGVTIKEWKVIEGLWGDEAESAMREFAESGDCDIIWPHGGYNDNVDNIKADYPDIMFVEVGSGVLEYGDNNYHFWLRCHEPSYAMGVLAGHLSDTNIFGGVGTYPASDVNDSLNSFFDGAESVKGEIERKVAFINSWYDPAAANEAAAAQIAAGAEHIDMYAETFDTCAEEEVICYGAYNDYSEFYPTTALASFVVKWDSAIEWAVEEWVAAVTGDGFDAPESPTYTLASDGSCDVKLSDELASTLPAEALEAFNQTREAIIDGSLKVEFNDALPESD
jgi:basic membrane lipoprotein Med (substrate-binding protein (PBP1-ABC) superfamily)